MRVALKAKQAPVLIWFLFAILSVSAVVVWRSAGTSAGLARLPETILASDTAPSALARIAQGAKTLATLRQHENEVAGPDGSLGPLIAPSPPSKPGSADVKAFGLPDAVPSLIVVASRRGMVAMLNGRTLHVGNFTSEGDVVQQIGSTFVILKAASGEARRIDMKDRFMLRPVLSNQETLK